MAGVDFMPHPGYAAPGYFSGTNARAFYRAYVTSPHNHIAKMEILLNDIPTQTLSTPFVPGWGGEEGGTLGGLIPVQEIAVMFDSFYFANGSSTITVKCRVLAETQPGGAQQWFEHSYSAPSKNKAAIFSLQELEDGSTPGGQGGAATEIRMNMIGYPYSFTWANGWTGATFESMLLQDINTVCYVGHSNQLNIENGVRPHNHPQDDIYAMTADGTPSVEAMRVAAIDYPWPPFNPSGKPAFNIVAHFSCRTISTIGAYSTYLYPFWNGYNMFLEDQSFMGFKVGVYLADYLALASEYWGALNGGYRAETARLIMMNSPAGMHYGLSDSEILGDDDSRFRRVYYPGSSSLLWWRSIPMP